MKVLFNQLQKIQFRLDAKIKQIADELEDKIEFDFHIENVTGDGWCICHHSNETVASLKQCLKIIKNTGKLTSEQHNKISF